MLFGLFITLGVAVLSVAMRSYESSFSQKVGALGILTASFLAIYYITGSWVLGFLSALSWLFLPWLEILTRIRALRLPREKALRPKSPPSAEVFPTLEEISTRSRTKASATSATRAGIGRITGNSFGSYYKEEDRAQATICLNEQNDLSFYYLRISSRTRERHHLDDVELSALLRAKIDPAISNQPAATRPIVLATLSKPQGLPSRARKSRPP